MAIDEIKAISIKDYLGNMSIYPTKNYSYYGMYKSPFRNEHTPSFKVDYNQKNGRKDVYRERKGLEEREVSSRGG